MKSFSLVIALSLGLATTAFAETRYVSDRLEIQMRTGKGTQFRILRMLPSGTALEVLVERTERLLPKANYSSRPSSVSSGSIAQ